MAEKFDLKAALAAAVAAGAVFIVLEMLLVAFVGGDSPWAPPRMIAAIALGPSVLPPPTTFDVGIVMAGLAVHLALSIVYAVLLGWAVAMFRMSAPLALLAGALFGLLLYAVNFYLFTETFPWFAMARNWMSILAHGVFGAVLGIVYRAASGLSRSAEPSAR